MEFPSPTLDNDALESLEARITEVWGHINTATFRFLELVGEFDRTRGWARHGHASCAQWLNWQCGINGGSAREKVRVARALADLPQISDAFRQGRVSYSKVRAMTRVATAENEGTLLNIALHGTASHVEKTVRKFTRVRRDMDRHRADAVHRSRYLDWWHEEDGSCRLQARLAPEVAAVVRQAIEAAMAAESEKSEAEAQNGGQASHTEDESQTGTANADEVADVSAETSAEQSSPRARRADALRHMAEQYLTHRAEVSGAAADRYQVVVHIAREDLSEAGTTDRMGMPDAKIDAIGAISRDNGNSIPNAADGLVHSAELEQGQRLAVAAARRLGCDGSLVGILEDAQGEPLNVGRKTRAIPAAIRRALRSRDGGCRFPGCDHSRFVHAHHIRHWADGGETRLGNLVTLCSYHHRLVHEGGYAVRVEDGTLAFKSPDGRPILDSGWSESWREQCFRGNIRIEPDAEPGELPLAEYNARRGVDVDAKTARCGWRGEEMDYGIAVEALCWESGLRI